jgi:hypothetical protein
MPLWTGVGYEYQESEWELSRKFDREGECEKCSRNTMVNYCHTCEDCMHREWQRWRDTPRITFEQEMERIRKEGEDYERRKKALENPFGFGGEIPFEIQLVGLGLLMFFIFMAIGLVL